MAVTMANCCTQVLPCARQVKWIHVLSAGVDKILFPELIESPVPVTNGRGVFKDSLAEFCMASILFFAKDLRRLVSSQEAGRWEQFDVVQIRGHVLGVVGYGEIGRETARLARALGMKVVAVRRRAALSVSDRDLERVYPPEGLRDMLGVSDYVVVSTPLTPRHARIDRGCGAARDEELSGDHQCWPRARDCRVRVDRRR